MAATHFGHCQICNRQHKVTGTRIAKHGFTIRFGWQEGACYGSGGKPYELSNDLILKAIDAAKAYIARTEEKITALKANPVDAEGYVTARVGAKRYSAPVDTYYADVKLEMVSGSVEATTRSGRRVFLSDFNHGVHDLAKAIATVSGRYVMYLARTVTEARSTIPELQKRHDSWKPAKLIPISSEQKAAEAPKMHFQVKLYGMTTTACSGSAMGAQRNTSKMKTTDASKVTCAACQKEAARLAAKAAAN